MEKKKRMMSVTIGADIELFLKERNSNRIVSAEGLILGTKHEPFNFDPSNKFFATSLDNVLAEFCVPPVSILDKEGFFNNIMKSIEYINKTIPADLCTVATPAAMLEDVFLQTENAQLFGCEPDYNVWLRDINPKPEAVEQSLRSAGGHIHVGWEEEGGVALETRELLIKCMDLHIGVPSVLQEPDNKRKELYGKAGAFRIKDYGAEYRTVSNYYAGDKTLTDWIVRATQHAINKVNDGFDIDAYGEEIQQAINNNDKTVAMNLINALELEMA